VTGGYMFLIGPSISVQVKPKLWIGGTLFAGLGAQKSPIVGARGEVPEAYVGLNGSDEVNVIVADTGVPEEDVVSTGIAFGLGGEISYAIGELGTGKSTGTGSLLVSAWPQALRTWSGFAFALPVGIGYRFH
jgi:hypothetical protein